MPRVRNFTRLEIQKRWRDANPDKVAAAGKRWRALNAVRHAAKNKAWRQSNADRVKFLVRRAHLKRLSTDANYKLRCNLKTAICNAIKKYRAKKAYKTNALLGCTIEFFRHYIESQFEPWMKWENHGKRGKFGFEIDHIIPLASFDLTDPEQQKQAFHYSNQQPLHWLKNRSKGDGMPPAHQRQLI